MSTAFDNMYLPGGDNTFASPDLVNFDTFDAAPNDGTISPTELYNDDFIMSAPPSASIPNFNTPESGYLESPATGLNTTPMEDGYLDGTLDYAELDQMAPLFPQDEFDQFAQQPMLVKPTFTPVNSRPSTGSTMVRQKSSPGRPPSTPFSHGRKHSESAGIMKNSKPRKSLPEITIDSEDDKETAKRKKNTAAARKSRMRKQEHAELQDAEIQRLRAIVYRLGGDPDQD